MEIKQKKLSTHHNFSFKENHFTFSFTDKTGADEVDIDYGNFPQKKAIRIEQNEWLRNVGYLWIILGAIFIVSALLSGTSLSGKGFWIMIGAICVLWAHFTKIVYSVYKSADGNVFIMQDDKHDQIVNEIQKRKRIRLTHLYGEIDYENELDNEVSKFKWLVDEGVMTEEASELKIAELELFHKKHSDENKELIN